jgi:maltooligosyltrehalose synthase
VLVPRLTAALGVRPVGDAWENTEVALDDEDAAGSWRELFTGQKVTSGTYGLPLAELFAEFPWAVLTRA